MQRLKTRAQYEAAMAGGTPSRTPHFVLHRAALDRPSDPSGPASERRQALFAVQDVWIGAVVPKRWAKRSVTRNGIKRQIYTVSAAYASRLPQAAHVVRLRTGLGADFRSAWSGPLKHAVRSELVQLFERAARPAGSAPSPAVPPSIPELAAPGPVDPAQAGPRSSPPPTRP